MIKNPISVNANSSLNQVLAIMTKENISHTIVTDDEKKIVGVISKNDLMQKFRSVAVNSSGQVYANLELNNIKSKDIMTEGYISVAKDDPLDYAIELLLQKQFHCLPVIEDNKAIGIVTFYDLLKGYYQEFG